MEKPTFPPSFYEELARENPLGDHRITAQDAQDWFEFVWPEIREYYAGRRGKPRWKLRIVRWWVRVDEDVLSRARIRASGTRNHETALRLQVLADRALSATSAPLDDGSGLPPMRTGGRRRG